jgi:hypothetical protein
MQRAEQLADQALTADPGKAVAHLIKALVIKSMIVTGQRTPKDRQWSAAIAEAETARDLDPNFASAHAEASMGRLFRGHAEEGFSGLETAIKLSPRDPVRPIWEVNICHLHSHLAQWDKAIEHCHLAVQGAPYVWFPYADLVAANAWLGRGDEAKAALADLSKVKPGLTAKMYTDEAATFSDNPVFTQQISRMVEGMRKAGLPEE